MNAIVTLYLALLAMGVVSFVLYYVAPLRIGQRLRENHPQQWLIIAEPEQGKRGALRTWIRLQHALRSTRPKLPQLLQDVVITRWFRVWQWAPWLAWGCWFAAMAVQWRAR